MRSVNHILLITPGFPADESDENCIPALQVFLGNFRELYPEITISVISLQYPYTENSYRWKEMNVHPCGGKNRKGIYKWLTWKKAETAFKKIYSSLHVDLIHSFWLGEAAMLGKKFAERIRVPHMTTVMGQDALPQNIYLKVKNFRDTPMVAPSAFCLQTLINHFKGSSASVIPWGIDPVTPENILSEKNIDVLGVGSLIPLKQFDQFIEGIEKLFPSFPAIRAVIIGDGSERKYLSEMIEGKNLSANITLAGELPRKEVLQYMCRSKVLFHPSRYESFGMVFAEALNAGMKIVSYKTGCYFNNESWAGVNDFSEFPSALKKMLEQQNATDAKNYFPVKDTCAKYYELYRLLLNKPAT